MRHFTPICVYFWESTSVFLFAEANRSAVERLEREIDSIKYKLSEQNKMSLELDNKVAKQNKKLDKLNNTIALAHPGN